MRLRWLFPWIDEEEEMNKEKRTEEAIKKAKKVEDKVRALALAYHAEGIVIAKVRSGNTR